MSDYETARAMWDGMESDERGRLLEACGVEDGTAEGDPDLVDHDFAALPPEVRSEIIANTPPPEIEHVGPEHPSDPDED